ncbi:hypothetical protein [Paenibacillus campi]|uniref:hypothetical protein n=1 Tax=Paenibacillus campi TaxID=3106031 RepID=UPI002AFFD8B0|nr:hypothetical protein [Paenibacillus sp. SGZ-1009]
MSISTTASEQMVLHDYKLEDWLRQTYGGQAPHITKQPKQPTWQQRVLVAAGHAINAYYTMSPELREISHIGTLVDLRWPRRPVGFESEAHYWEIKDAVIANLAALLRHNQPADYPVILYEQHRVIVPELHTELSLIFQAVWQLPWTTAQPGDEPSGHKSLIVQKFFWEREPHLEEAFIHLSNVFCRTAFGCVPQRIDMFYISDGTMQRHVPEQEHVAGSIDYVDLLRHAVPGGNRLCACCRANAGTAVAFAPTWSVS